MRVVRRSGGRAARARVPAAAIVADPDRGVEALRHVLGGEHRDSFVPRLREAMITMLALRPDFDDAAGHEAHAALAEAIAARDADRAGHLSRAHLTSLAEGVHAPR